MKPAAIEPQSAMFVSRHQLAWFLGFSVLFVTAVHVYRPSLSTVQFIFRASPSLSPFTPETSAGVQLPSSRRPSSLSVEAQDGTSSTNSSDGGGGVCNPYTGDWVAVPNYQPYYTNDTCPDIHEQQNCMKHGRPDTGYLHWRWQPDGCDLPRFDASRFLEMVRGKTMAFVGDSLARNQMQSLKCILSSVSQPLDISDNPDDPDNKRLYFPSYNFTLLTFWSPVLVNGHSPPTNGNERLWAMYLDEPYTHWATRLRTFDYLILSDGNWFVKPSLFFQNNTVIGCHDCNVPGVKDLTMLYSNRMAFRTALKAVTNPASRFKGAVFLRTLSPDHFENGEWDTGGYCNRTEPLLKDENVGLKRVEFELYKAQVEEFLDAKAKAVGRGIQFRLLDTTQAMVQRVDGHPNKYGHWPYANTAFRNDCVHWCMPGPVDVWNELLMFEMANM